MSIEEGKSGSLFGGKKLKFPTAPDIFGMKAKKTKSGYARLSQDERIEKSLEAAAIAAEKDNPQLATCLRTMKPIISILIKLLLVIIPIYQYIFKWCIYLYYVLPKNALSIVFGLALCFFGGSYLAVFAAVEGFRKMGWERAYKDLCILHDATKDVLAASEHDDDQDDNRDGIADVDQISPEALLKRKIAVAMVAIKEPWIVQDAIGSLWAAYLAVLATLKMQFAQTTAIALGIAEMVKFPIVRIISPLLAAALGKDLNHWADTILDTTINFIAICFAWFLQMIISAFYSGLRGGKYIADGLFGLLDEHGLLEKFPDCLVKKPYNPDETYLDEIVMYAFFAGGFSYQILHGFHSPFPINIILLPVWFIEQFLRWQITFASASTGF